jgi:hypothetical protein
MLLQCKETCQSSDPTGMREGRKTTHPTHILTKNKHLKYQRQHKSICESKECNDIVIK